MKHPRTLIREALAARIVGPLHQAEPRITAARISIHRATPLFPAKLPAILIYTRDERIEDKVDRSTGLRRRVLDLSVEIVTSGDTAAIDADRLALVIESVVDADETLGRMVDDTHLVRTEIDQDGEGDTVFLAVRLRFEVTYWSHAFVEEGHLPVQVLFGWEPETGIPHREQYQLVINDTVMLSDAQP